MPCQHAAAANAEVSSVVMQWNGTKKPRPAHSRNAARSHAAFAHG